MPTLKEIAEDCDMSEANASIVMRALGVDWKTATLAECRWRYIRDLRATAAGRGGDDQGNLAKQRARQAAADANLKELEYQVRTGELVDMNVILPLLESYAVSASAEIQNMVAKLVAAIESKHGIEIDQGTVDDMLCTALDAIAAYPRGEPEDDGAGVPAILAPEEDIDA